MRQHTAAGVRAGVRHRHAYCCHHIGTKVLHGLHESQQQAASSLSDSLPPVLCGCRSKISAAGSRAGPAQTDKVECTGCQQAECLSDLCFTACSCPLWLLLALRCTQHIDTLHTHRRTLNVAASSSSSAQGSATTSWMINSSSRPAVRVLGKWGTVLRGTPKSSVAQVHLLNCMQSPPIQSHQLRSAVRPIPTPILLTSHIPTAIAADPNCCAAAACRRLDCARSRELCESCRQPLGAKGTQACSPANLLCVTCPGFTCLPPAGLRPFAAAARSTARYCRASDVLLLLWRAAACLKKSKCAEAATTSTSWPLRVCIHATAISRGGLPSFC